MKGADSDEEGGSPREQTQEELEEQAALARIILTFRDYQQSAEWEVARWQSNYAQLPPHHKALIPHQPAKLAAARAAVNTNMFFIKSLLQAFDPDCASGPLPPHLMVPPALRGPDDGEDGCSARVNANDIDKVRYVLKNVVRDWSAEGAAERLLSYGRILAELQDGFKDWSNAHRPPRVLVPGAGLARLCVEIAALGYEAQGNEYSYFMLLAVMTAWPTEAAAMNNMIDHFGTGIYACALSEVLPSVAVHKLSKGGYLVLRPDSGDPTEAVLMALAAAEKVFGATRNAKGFKVIPGCGVIQGDGIDLPTMEKIANAIEAAGFAADNV
ncbi:hypothetical protein HYH02_006798 [Chlamydomonas schloesseri]|uniref:Nicotinate/nicotinamide phosphoribosyltransferase domain-containing protein n=1 Tax=Chlamydomonas schloesseri TaxID=2026947 RepID=A0A835WII0_9CHLO|nr:hypothetical protein HYH02_006798 [Chlamydomonas schloesseri]|eukprot:KAG2448213.1 hypothetical protein HYH02_006798 [Chlamydomonas schloesseri]